MSSTWIEVLSMIGISGATGLITWLVTIKIQRKKEGAFADQEVAKVDQEKANAIDKTGDIYKKLTAHVDEMLDDMRAELKEVKEENKVLKQEVKQLSTDLDFYKKKCKNCTP